MFDANIRPNKHHTVTTAGDNGPMDSGALLKEIREGLGLTQQELAQKLGYSRPVVSNAERGNEISRPYLERFAERVPEVAPRLEDVAPTAKPRGGSQTPLRGEVVDEMFFRRSNVTTDLDGDWFALWETTADHKAVLNTEQLVIKMKRDRSLTIQNVSISDENPEGGYLWLAHARLFDNQYILGTYIPREPNVRSKGCLYLVLHQSGRFISGQWIGCNYDGDWARGLVVMGRTPDKLRTLMKKHREQIPVMPYNVDIEKEGERK